MHAFLKAYFSCDWDYDIFLYACCELPLLSVAVFFATDYYDPVL